jgi:hypothetical protein
MAQTARQSLYRKNETGAGKTNDVNGEGEIRQS